jgi:glycosyltransferase involved in cell wall biosynthesis
VPVVQTLHNFRLLCPGALFFRDDKICEECLRGDFKPALKHRCYRESNMQTRAVVRMLEYHRKIGTYKDKVSKYIALTNFCRNKFIEAGFPSENIAVKPNFISNPPEPRFGGDYALFAGRLSREKGIHVLLEAWKGIDFPLKICGDGPERANIEKNLPENAELLGRVQPEKVMEFLSGSRFLVFPSVWYEGFPRIIVESFAAGKPVVASKLGSAAELVENVKTGLLFEPGNSAELHKHLKSMIAKPDYATALGRNALDVFQRQFSADKNLAMLMDIYKESIKHASDMSGRT